MSGRRTKILIALLAVISAIVASKIRLFGLVFDRAEIQAEWGRVSDSPGAKREYAPQGMAFVDGDLLVTNHWHGERSCLYRLDPATGEVTASAPMPEEATHTSGLAWDGDSLWAVDHASNLLYQLDVAASFEEGQAVVEQTVETGLRASSGLTLLRVNDRQYLAVSDFLWTIETSPSLPLGSGHTYLAPLDRVSTGTPVRECADLSYSNGGYSQGLAWDGTYLYESCNTIGTNRVDVRDVLPALEGDRAVDHIGSFEAPGWFVEDLGTDGSSLWTTDEGDYGLYELDSLDAIRRDVRG